MYAFILGMICLGLAGKVFLAAREKAAEAAFLEATLASSREELARVKSLEHKVAGRIPAPPAGYVPARAEELMVHAFLELPRMAESHGMEVLEIKSVNNPSTEGTFAGMTSPLPAYERIRQGEVRVSVRFEDLASIRSFLDSVEKMGGYVKSGKIRNTQAEFTLGFVGI